MRSGFFLAKIPEITIPAGDTTLNRGSGWVVHKFGGTSVASPASWETIREAIANTRAEGRRPLVVCSALSGISDRLDELLAARDRGRSGRDQLVEIAERHHEFAAALGIDGSDLVEDRVRTIERRLAASPPGQEVPPPIRAEVMAAGELLLTGLAARWLAAAGAGMAWRDARRLLCVDPPPDGACARQAFLSAVCASASHPDEALVRALDTVEESGIITQGFIARDRDGRTVLLGRGGSDVAAAHFAARIGADRLEIWTDVPGIFTANPQTAPGARLLSRLSYNEAESLAGLGAKVLHPRTIEPVRQAGVPLRIRWTAHPDAVGTEVTEDGGDAGHGVKAVSARGHMCLVTMVRPQEWQPVGFMADVAACFKEHALCMDLVSSSPSRIQTTLDLDAAPGTPERIPALLGDLKRVCDPEVRYDVATVSLVGRGIRNTMHEYAPKLGILHDKEILMISPTANDLSISFAVPRRQEEELVHRLHRVLFEEFPLDDHFGPTLAEIEASAPVLEDASARN
jgi:diaminopimelate decarboxylase/aspartate kinase